MHTKQIVKLLALIMLVVSFVMLVPLAISINNGESSSTDAFVKTIALIMAISVTVLLVFNKTKLGAFSQKDGYFFTVLTWVLVAAFGALPLVLSGAVPSYSDAFFELMSGLTTTGATSIADVEILPRSILFWRSLTNWLGGMGIVVLFVALLPALGPSGGSYNLIGAETVGPVKGKLTPKTKTTAVVLWLIYFGLTVAQIIALLISGLSLYDSVTISFSTLSTAGFTTKNASIGGFNSSSVEVITTVFMVLASINFSLYYKALTGKFRDIRRDSEFKWFWSIFLSAVILGTICLWANRIYSFGESLRHMAFQVASIMTTTGFSTVEYLNWPSFSIMVLVLMMFVGGCAGSTGGGIKVARISIVVKASINSLKQKIHPTGVFVVTDSNNPVEKNVISSVFAFCGIYILTWLLGALIISLSGASVESCLSSSMQCLGNTGAGFGDYGYGCFASYPAWTKWVFSFLMLAGRLELFTLYSLFVSSFRRH